MINADDLQIGMWFKTNTGHVSKIKSIDRRFPLQSVDKFCIIYSDDDKTCWGIDNIVQIGWNIDIK